MADRQSDRHSEEGMSTSSDDGNGDKDVENHPPAAPQNVVASQSQGVVSQSQGVVSQSQGGPAHSQGGASGESLFKLKNAVVKILGRFFHENVAPFNLLNLFRFLS